VAISLLSIQIRFQHDGEGSVDSTRVDQDLLAMSNEDYFLVLVYLDRNPRATRSHMMRRFGWSVPMTEKQGFMPAVSLLI